MKKTGKKKQAFFSCFLCLLWLAAMLPVSAAAETTREAVRVGWYEDSYHITGENGERSGYGYEYEQAIASYTGWNYEYVNAGWSDLLSMLQNGEIDMMGAISYTDDRAETMLFSDLPMGQEKYYLYADLSDTDISASDLSTLNGKRIVVLENSIQEEQFTEWEEKHQVKTQHIYLNSVDKARKLAEEHKIDGVISTETPIWVELGMSAIVTTGGSDIYYGISKTRPDIKEQLDIAMRKMENDMPFYGDELYKKYLSAVSSNMLSSKERAWLEEHGAIRMGWVNNDSGFSTLNIETGQLTGVVCDYVSFAVDCLGEDTLQFDLIGFDSQEEQLRALKNGQIDAAFHISQNPYAAERNGLILSNTVLEAPLAAVTEKASFDESAANTVAVEKSDLAMKWHIAYNYPKWKVVEYDTMEAVEKAVLHGEADCFLTEVGRLTEYIKNSRYRCIFLTGMCGTSFAVQRSDTILMAILNKTLKAMQSAALTSALSMYENSLQKVTAADFLRDNMFTVAACFITVFTLILLLILRFLQKSKIAEANARQAAAQAQELNAKLRESQQELRAALQRAESASAAKTIFLSNVSHDIRTPMNAIMGLTTLMENDLENPVKLREYIGKLKTSGQHLLNLINEILDMNKIESGKATLHIEPFTLAEQVAQIDNVIRPQAGARRQHYVVQTHGIRHEHLEGDATRMQQVLLNILSNAVKYTGEGGHISLEIEEMPRTGHYARFRFTVTDNGAGMSEEFQKHIYEAFTRAENSVTNKVQGTGLGMAITKSIVDMMGGSISLQSEVGKGSRFEVILEFKINEEADHAVKKSSLLLLRCDDDTFTRIRTATENSPVTIYRTTGPEETVQLLQNGHYDVVLMPYTEYGGGLKEAVQRLRSLAGEETVLLGIAAASRDEALEVILDSGLDGFVPKPFFLSNVEAEVERVKEQRRTGGTKPQQSVLVGMKLLCAEDNEINSEILRAMLQMQGASCTICHNGAEIAEKFRLVKPGEYDAILMDVQMPVMDGYEATRAIRSGENPLGKTIPIIAMTANAFAEDVQKSYEAGMDAHLSKPVDLQALEQTLRRFCGQHDKGL